MYFKRADKLLFKYMMRNLKYMSQILLNVHDLIWVKDFKTYNSVITSQILMF